MITPSEAIALDPDVRTRRDLTDRIDTAIRIAATLGQWPCEIPIERKFEPVLETVRAGMYGWKTSVIRKPGFLPQLRVERPAGLRGGEG